MKKRGQHEEGKRPNALGGEIPTRLEFKGKKEKLKCHLGPSGMAVELWCIM